MSRISKSEKAISPILATLLLIVIAVAAIVVTYAWVMTYMGAQTSQAGVFLSKDTVSWPDSSTIVLYIRNTGTSDAKIDALYVGTSSTNLAQIAPTNLEYDPTNKIVAANGGLIKITISHTWANATTYYFRVSPQVGVSLEFNHRSP